MKKCTTALFSVCLLALAVLLGACRQQEARQPEQPSAQPLQQAYSSTGKPALRIGMGAMLTPREGYVFYQQLARYIAGQLGMPVQLVDRGNYDEMNNLLKTGGVDAAFVCAGPYVEGRQQFGLQLLAMPLVNGKPLYYSYIIVPAGSSARRLEDLRGTSFAFTDPKSNSGRLVPTYLLSKIGETPEHFFSKTHFTYGHDKSIRAVAEGLVNGAAVDSLIWEYTKLKNPQLTARTRILLRSDPYGIPPVVVRAGLNPQLKRRLQYVLLHAADHEEGRQILKGIMIDRFVEGDDRNYATIRAMNRWLQKLGEQH